MSEGKTHDDGRQSDLAVLEANEYKQRRRLERLLDMLDGVQDTADGAWAAYVAGEISRDARNITIQRSVQNAIRECYKLLLDHARQVRNADENGDELQRDRYWLGDPEHPLGTVDVAGEDVAQIVGLKHFLQSDRYYTLTVEQTVQRRNLPSKTVTKEVETTMPEDVSFAAYLRLKEFLDDVHDLEVSFEEIDDSRPYNDWREQYEDGVYEKPEDLHESTG